MTPKRQGEIKDSICDAFVSVLRTLSPFPEDDAFLLCSVIQSKKLEKMMVGTVKPFGLLEDTILMHNEAGSYKLRVLAISHVAGKLSFDYLSQFNEGPGTVWNPKLNKKIYYVAKKENIEHGHGLTKVNETKQFRQRLNPEVVKCLYDFLNGTSLVQNTAYGTVSRKSDSGQKLTMAQIVRVYERPKLIKMGNSYLEEIGYAPLSVSFFYTMFDNMPAAGPVQMKGVNPFYVSNFTDCFVTLGCPNKF